MNELTDFIESCTPLPSRPENEKLHRGRHRNILDGSRNVIGIMWFKWSLGWNIMLEGVKEKIGPIDSVDKLKTALGLS